MEFVASRQRSTRSQKETMTIRNGTIDSRIFAATAIAKTWTSVLAQYRSVNTEARPRPANREPCAPGGAGRWDVGEMDNGEPGPFILAEPSSTDVAGVDAARQPRVACALHDDAAVGENRQQIRRGLEA